MTRRLLLVAGLLIAPMVAAAQPAAAEDPTPQVPCVDPRGCPDLVVDGSWMAPVKSTETFSEQHCAVVEGMVEPGTRTLMRFHFVSLNQGDGALVIGNPAKHKEWFAFAKCHHHYHFKEFADYRLWTPEGHALWDILRTNQPDKTAQQVLAENPLLSTFFVAGQKQGFCVVDGIPYPIPNPDERTYLWCNNQGLSRGWADIYGRGMDGQWVDVTGLAPGTYVLEQENNAERMFAEADYTNNRASMEVTI